MFLNSNFYICMKHRSIMYPNPNRLFWQNFISELVTPVSSVHENWMNVKSKEIWKVYQRDTRKSFNLEKLRPTYVVVSWLETFLLLISKMHQSLQNWQKAWIRGQKTGVLFKNIEGAYKFDLESVFRITKY